MTVLGLKVSKPMHLVQQQDTLEHTFCCSKLCMLQALLSLGLSFCLGPICKYNEELLVSINQDMSMLASCRPIPHKWGSNPPSGDSPKRQLAGRQTRLVSKPGCKQHQVQ